MIHFVVRRILCATLILSLPTGGCALIVNGTQDSVFIDSQPPGATVRVDGQAVARTPAKIYLHRGYSQQVTLEKEGYLPENVFFPNHFDAGWILFDLILTLGLGIPIDVVSGAMWNFSPDHAVVRMRPLP